MNLTFSLLAGLLLLLPGLTALASWNVLGNREAARRPDLPLTAVSALFVTLSTAVLVHTAGFGIIYIVAKAAEQWNQTFADSWALPALRNPYPAALSLADGKLVNSDPAGLFELLVLILVECVFVFRFVASPAVGLAFHNLDLRGVGWAFKHYLQPLRHGYTPFAFVMTTLSEDGRGLGYCGPIDELKLGDFGEVKTISIGRAQRFIYELQPGKKSHLFQPKTDPLLLIHSPHWVGDMVQIDGAKIENIAIHNFAAEALEAYGAGNSPRATT